MVIYHIPTVLTQTFYSSNLNICGYFLFLKIETRLHNCHPETIDNTEQVITHQIKSMCSGSPRGVVANVLKLTSLLASSDSGCFIAFTFGLIPSRKVRTFLLLPELWVLSYHYCSSTRLKLALNNPRRLICHLNFKGTETEIQCLLKDSGAVFKNSNNIFIGIWLYKGTIFDKI